MKTLFILSILLISSFGSFGQFSRGLVSFGSNVDIEGAELIPVGDDFYHITTEFHTDDSTSFLHFSILDKNGDSKKVLKIPVQENLRNCKILGAEYFQSENKIVIPVEQLGISPSINMLKYYQLTVPNHILSVQAPNFSSRISNLTRSQFVGDSVVVYALKEGEGLIRISNSIENLNAMNFAVIDSIVPFVISSFNNRLSYDRRLSVDYIYANGSNKLYKRYGSDSTVSVDLSSLGIGINSRLSCADDRILLVSTNKMFLFDLNLDSIQTLTKTFINRFDVVSLYNDFYFVSKKNTESGFTIQKLSPTLVLLEEKYLVETATAVKLKRINGRIFYTLNHVADSYLDLNTASNPTCTTSGYRLQVAGVFQYFNDITEPDDFYGKIESNKVEGDMNSGTNVFGRMYRNYNYRTVGYKDSLQNFLYYSMVGMIGVNSQGIFGNHSSYNEASNTFMPGPVTDPSQKSELLVQQYSTIFHVSREMIREHLDILQSPPPNYVPVRGIRNWPAHGDITLGQAANLAPFVDVNNNGIYEPMEGDYPKIFGDDCFLKVISQPLDHVESTASDWFMYTYTYNCDTNEVIENVIFNQVQIVPRLISFDEVFVSTYSDYDIGFYGDDYYGIDIDLNLTYQYNGDNFDENNGNQVGYGAHVVASGNMILKGVQKSANGQDDAFGPLSGQSVNGIGFGDGIPDNEYWGMTSSALFTNGDGYPGSDPTNLAQTYNYAKGYYQDGSDKLINGIPVKQMYFGSSDPLFYASGGVDHGNNHSEIVLNRPAGDRRVLGFSGPGSYAVGDTIQYLQAYLVALDTIAPSHLKSVDKLKEYAALLQYYYSINDLGCGKTFDGIEESLGTDELKKLNHNLKLYPNPFAEQFVIEGLEGEAIVRIRDMNGRLLQEQKNVSNGQAISVSNWQGQVFLVEIESQGYTVVKKMIKN